VLARPPVVSVGQVGGSANALTATVPANVTLADLDGVLIIARGLSANTGAATLELTPSGGASLGAKDIVSPANAALTGGEIAGANALIGFVYVSSLDDFLMVAVNPGSPVAVVGTARNLIVRSGSPQASRVTVEAEELVVKTTGGIPKLLSSVSVNADLNGAGTGAGQLDTGSEANDTFYHIYVIHNPSTNNTTGLLSTSMTSPVLPSGYTYFARVGVARNDSAGDFIFFQSLDWEYSIEGQDANANAAAPTVLTSLDLSDFIPVNAKIVQGTVIKTNNSQLKVHIQGDPTNSLGLTSIHGQQTGTVGIDSAYASGQFRTNLRTAQTIYWKSSTADTHQVVITGYRIG
jgi:hypothetical protein